MTILLVIVGLAVFATIVAFVALIFQFLFNIVADYFGWKTVTYPIAFVIILLLSFFLPRGGSSK